MREGQEKAGYAPSRSLVGK